MDLKIEQELFLVLGATDGFGKAICERLLEEDAYVIGVARNEAKLKAFEKTNPFFTGIVLDLFEENAIDALLQKLKGKNIRGVLVNAGGPPATTALESTLNQWDEAYRTVVRWKIELTKKILPWLQKPDYARMVFIESAAVKQPIENLVLSNSFRMAIVGFVKTLSQEMSDSSLTFNILAPGYHKTSAVDRLIKKKAENNNLSEPEALVSLKKTLPGGKIGDPDHMAGLAAWLFSPYSSYVNGQVFYIDGGSNKSTL